MTVFELLRQEEYFGKSEAIEIAKGKNKLPETFKESFKQLKRRIKWLRK